MYRSILVPLDGSMFGEHALPLALAITRQSGAHLRIARVHVPLISPIDDLGGVVERASREEAKAYLGAVVKRLKDRAAVSIESALLDVPIIDAICNHATTTKSDLIIMTTHGRGALVRAWLGSVAHELIRSAPVPLLLVRSQESKPNLDKHTDFRRILIPLDGSSLAEQVIEGAIVLGGLTQAEYMLVRVVEPMIVGNGQIDEAFLGPANHEMIHRLQIVHDEAKEIATKYLDTVAERFRSRDLRVETQVLVHEQPAIAVLDAVKKVHADMIAVSTHGRRGLARLFLGSVADKLLRGADVPVLIFCPAAN